MSILLNDADAKAVHQALVQNGQAALAEKLAEKLLRVANEERFRQVAFERDHEDGVLEIDDDAIVSAGADGQGAYVQAWTWVSNEEI